MYVNTDMLMLIGEHHKEVVNTNLLVDRWDKEHEKDGAEERLIETFVGKTAIEKQKYKNISDSIYQTKVIT